MKKAKITRQVVRLVLGYGRKLFSDVSPFGAVRWTSTLRIENVAYEVVWTQMAGHVLVVTAYRVGEYD